MAYPLSEGKWVDFAAARRHMVQGQLQTNGISHPELLALYAATPREKFIDASMAASAYLDEDIRIPGTNRWILEPLVEARLLQMAMAGRRKNALAIGAASLPSIEMLAAMVGDLTVTEPDRGLASAAKLRLERPNATVIETSGHQHGYPRTAPYDIIFMSGAVASVSPEIKAQLALGGSLVAVLRPRAKEAGRIILMKRLSQDIFDTIYGPDALTPYLEGFAPKTGFAF